jgi:hypothetical protein
VELLLETEYEAKEFHKYLYTSSGYCEVREKFQNFAKQQGIDLKYPL